MSKEVAYLPWFTAVEFERFRELFPVRFPGAYDAWVRSTEQVIELNRASGVETEAVEVHAEGFLAWCRATGREPEGNALLAYTDLVGAAKRSVGG